MTKVLMGELYELIDRHVYSSFGYAEEARRAGLWFDGIIPFEDYQLRQKYVNDNRKIKTTAWIGKGPRYQTQFEVMIYFGRYSLRRYAKGKSIEDCLPEIESEEHFLIDPQSALIELHLL